MLRSRELPEAEWPKLASSYLCEVWHILPSDARVIVVEENGAIVGTCVLLTTIHAEGLGVAPDHRRGGAVLRMLLRRVSQTVADLGKETMICGAMTNEMEGYLRRWGGCPPPAKLFAMPLAGVLRRLTRSKEN